MAQAARRSSAAMKRASKNAKLALTCPHTDTEIVTGEGYCLEHCKTCDSYGPFSRKTETTTERNPE